jgi:hypothetical protein
MEIVVSALKHARGQSVIPSARHFATLVALLVMPSVWAGDAPKRFASDLWHDMNEAHAHKVSVGYARDSRLAGEAKRREAQAKQKGDKEAEARARLVLHLARLRLEHYRKALASHYLDKMVTLASASKGAEAVVRAEYEERLRLLEMLRSKH